MYILNHNGNKKFILRLTLLFLYIMWSITGTVCPNLVSTTTNGFVTGFLAPLTWRVIFWTMVFTVFSDVLQVFFNAWRFGSDAIPAGRFGASVPVTRKFSLKYRSRRYNVSGVLGMKVSFARMRKNIIICTCLFVVVHPSAIFLGRGQKRLGCRRAIRWYDRFWDLYISSMKSA